MKIKYLIINYLRYKTEFPSYLISKMSKVQFLSSTEKVIFLFV